MRTFANVLGSSFGRASVRKRSILTLAVGLIAIAAWQGSFGRMESTSFDKNHRVLASTGIQGEPRFFFFLYHLGLFPIASPQEPRADTRVEAERLLRDEPKSLLQEIGLTFASGERGRVYLYYVDALIRGDRVRPGLRAANALAFSVALSALFFAFWWTRRVAVGVVLVAIFGSSPFQLDAIHSQENLFSWPLTTLILLLSLHAWLFGRWRTSARSFRWVLITALATGILLATIRQFRSEPTVMLAAPVFAYATLSRAKLWERLAPIVLCLGVFAGTSRGYDAILDAKMRSAQRTLIAAGGTPYSGPMVQHHEIWHPIWCGLGDFDTKYGYAWDDRVAYAYALGVAEQRAGKRIDLNPHFWAQKDFFDAARHYPVPFYDALPDYHEIIREKVVTDIKGDPRWYASILVQRVRYILTTTTPIALRVGDISLSFSASWLGPACVLLLVVLLLTQRFPEAKLLVFSTPLSLTALIVYSGRGMTSYSAYHLLGAAIFVTFACDGLLRWLFPRRRLSRWFDESRKDHYLTP